MIGGFTGTEIKQMTMISNDPYGVMGAIRGCNYYPIFQDKVKVMYSDMKCYFLRMPKPPMKFLHSFFNCVNVKKSQESNQNYNFTFSFTFSSYCLGFYLA